MILGRAVEFAYSKGLVARMQGKRLTSAAVNNQVTDFALQPAGHPCFHGEGKLHLDLRRQAGSLQGGHGIQEER